MMGDEGHIARVLSTLTHGWLKDKWTKGKLETDKDLHEILSQFLIEQEVNSVVAILVFIYITMIIC